ncbi:hypothetical protein PFICI_11626 [Pestalotiopsis fici W106-1]|uniref:3-carboxymuconate cyclase n=1 Tax=Pestalotiopsis fici (strain W106-1 / CGMCC3.15140) TaxID=1229662 RepID=W3WQY0_PESFW|nr:uncharacterized protein PFICI_11626 [Pestalotiopsis fici W106-1]ETS76239.1 hypothetical protein PFICI_11626 [Pestalotiopsis fici W106-1]
MFASILLFSSALFGLVQAACIPQSHNDNFPTDPLTLYVAHQGRGILTLQFDTTKAANESLGIVDETEAGHQPGWICSRDSNIYSVARTYYPDNSSVSGGVFGFTRIGDDLSKVSENSSDGNGGVFCHINEDGSLMSVANIDGSTVSLHPRSETGVVGASSHLFKYNLTQPGPGTNDSQIQSNPHEAVFGPSGPWGQLMVVPDRGADRVYVYRVRSSGNGTADVHLAENITLPLGTGPRHVIFQESLGLMYLVSELDNTVRVFSIDTSKMSNDVVNITLLQTASTLGPGSARTLPINEHLASELALSNNGRFLYVSNRDTTSYDSDNLAIFAVNRTTLSPQPLEWLGINATNGKIPRHFALSSDRENQWVAVANQVSNTIFVFKRSSENGFLEEVKGNLTLGDFDLTLENGPMAVVWARPRDRGALSTRMDKQ